MFRRKTSPTAAIRSEIHVQPMYRRRGYAETGQPWVSGWRKSGPGARCEWPPPSPLPTPPSASGRPSNAARVPVRFSFLHFCPASAAVVCQRLPLEETSNSRGAQRERALFLPVHPVLSHPPPFSAVFRVCSLALPSLTTHPHHVPSQEPTHLSPVPCLATLVAFSHALTHLPSSRFSFLLPLYLHLPYWRSKPLLVISWRYLCQSIFPLLPRPPIYLGIPEHPIQHPLGAPDFRCCFACLSNTPPPCLPR